MIQDIAPKKLNNQYDPNARPNENSLMVCIKDGSFVLRKTEDGVKYPSAELFRERWQDAIYLFSIDEDKYFLLYDAFAPAEEELGPDCFYEPVKGFQNYPNTSKEQIFALFTALHLYHWYRDNQFCGRCGHPTVYHEKERAKKCPHCGNMIFPKLLPAVIVGVINGDKILVTKYAGREMNFYALIAGFTEIGETMEQNVAREVMEEVGLKVKNIRYYKSQPWGNVDDLLLGFYCDVDGDPTIRLDENELKVGLWVTREELQLQPNDFSLTGEMMARFKEGLPC